MIGLIFLGPPGSGKGTQSNILAQGLGFSTISTGDLLRSEVKAESEIGLKVKDLMAGGKLVSDEIVSQIIKNYLANNLEGKPGFILDGFPRNLAQAKILENTLADINMNIDLVINIDVDDDVLTKRITGRFMCKDCGEVYNRFYRQTKEDGVCDRCGSKEFYSRSDDNEETIRNRLEVYHENSRDLVAFYQKKGLLYSISGVKNAPLISGEIRQAVLDLNKFPNNH